MPFECPDEVGSAEAAHAVGQEDIFTLDQCSGSITFWCGSDPAIFVIDRQDVNKKTNFSTIKSPKKSQNSRN
jgi:hypothetical protein